MTARITVTRVPGPPAEPDSVDAAHAPPPDTAVVGVDVAVDDTAAAGIVTVAWSGVGWDVTGVSCDGPPQAAEALERGVAGVLAREGVLDRLTARRRAAAGQSMKVLGRAMGDWQAQIDRAREAYDAALRIASGEA